MFILNTGFENLFNSIVSNYVTWIYLLFVIYIIVKDFLSGGGIRKIIQDVLVAVLVAVVVFGAVALFGATGIFTKMGTDLAKDIANTIIGLQGVQTRWKLRLVFFIGLCLLT